MAERMYTLEEARRIVLYDLCVELGEHDLEQESVRSMKGAITIIVFCTRCGTRFVEETPHD